MYLTETCLYFIYLLFNKHELSDDQTVYPDDLNHFIGGSNRVSTAGISVVGHS